MIFGALGELALGELGGITIAPSSIASAEAFGTATVLSNNAIVQPTAIVSAEAFGTATVTEDRIIAYEIASAEAFGTPSLIYYISPPSIASAEAFGTAKVWLFVTYLPVSRAD